MIDENYIAALKLTAESNFTMGQALLKVAEQLQTEADENKWVTIESAAAALGDISENMLKQRCEDGRFKYGVHFINSSDGKRGNYFVKVSAVRKFLETHPAKRPPAKS
jgi:hypothetical protein